MIINAEREQKPTTEPHLSLSCQKSNSATMTFVFDLLPLINDFIENLPE